jgi:hypothetical protein
VSRCFDSGPGGARVYVMLRRAKPGFAREAMCQPRTMLARVPILTAAEAPLLGAEKIALDE